MSNQRGKKYKITGLDSLKAFKKTNRDSILTLKPTISTDKKKKVNKNTCRNFKHGR